MSNVHELGRELRAYTPLKESLTVPSASVTRAVADRLLRSSQGREDSTLARERLHNLKLVEEFAYENAANAVGWNG